MITYQKRGFIVFKKVGNKFLQCFGELIHLSFMVYFLGFGIFLHQTS
jgi:hypothetical protein